MINRSTLRSKVSQKLLTPEQCSLKTCTMNYNFLNGMLHLSSIRPIMEQNVTVWYLLLQSYEKRTMG